MHHNKKILITGASGFIGKHLLDRLIEEPDYEVLGLNYSNKLQNTRVKQYLVDLRNLEQTKKVLTKVSPDIVFHLAGCDGKGVHKDFEGINVLATKNLLASLDEVPYGLFVFISTSEVYDSCSIPFKEEKTNPKTEYAKTKFAAEEICREYAKKGKPIVVIRVGVAYGPGQLSHFFIPDLILACLRKESFDMTEGEQTRDFIYIEDLVLALLKLPHNNSVLGKTINISSGKSISLKQIAEEIKKITNSSIKLNFGAIPYKRDEILKHQLEIEKAINLLQWEPKTGITEGLKKTIDWYKNNN